MTINVTGKIVEVLPMRSGVSKNGNEWKSQDFILEETGGDKLIFGVFGEDKLNSYNLHVGSEAAVTLKIEATSWNGKYFTKVSCLNCMSNTANQAATAQPTSSQPAPQSRPVMTPNLDAAAKAAPVSADSLPF
jgi:hypothetical protein